MSDECCPKFNPEKWEEKIYNWENKKFVKESMPTIFHMPLPGMIGSKVKKLFTPAQKTNAISPNTDEVLLLFRDPSAFKSEIYLSVQKNVPELENTIISWKFISKVFDWPYRDIPKFIEQMKQYLSGLWETPKDYYIHYAYCPKCSQKYGHNYMIVFAQV